MIIYIQATSPKITQEELLKQIPEAKKKELAGKGQLRAYTLAHEGVTHPRVIGEGVQEIKWGRKIVEKVKDLAKTGTKFFIGHNADNSTENRKNVGEVVTSFLKEIEGTLHNIVIGHFPDKATVSDLDIVSMEANIDTDMYNNVNDVKGITGIAMDSSESNSPAFPGARLVSAIQCFEKDKNEPGKGETEMTFAEAKQFIKDHNVHPSQLYSEKEIQNDREFSHIFDENAKMKADNELLTKTNGELTEKNKGLTTEKSASGVKDILSESLKEGYTDKQKDFINKRFKPESLESLDEDGVKKFLDNSKKEYADFAKLFGDSEGTNTGEEGDETSTRKSGDSGKDPVEAAMGELAKN